jgi:hypothetical protein
MVWVLEPTNVRREGELRFWDVERRRGRREKAMRKWV